MGTEVVIDGDMASACAHGPVLVFLDSEGEVVELIVDDIGAPVCDDATVAKVQAFYARTRVAEKPPVATSPAVEPLSDPTLARARQVVDEVVVESTGFDLFGKLDNVMTLLLVGFVLFAAFLVARVVREVAGALEILAKPFIAVSRWLSKRRGGHLYNAEEVAHLIERAGGRVENLGVGDRLFSAEDKAFIIKRAGGRCEDVDVDTGERCLIRTGLEADHAIAWANGGETHPDNGVALCRSHNARKGDKEMPQEWFDMIHDNRQGVLA